MGRLYALALFAGGCSFGLPSEAVNPPLADGANPPPPTDSAASDTAATADAMPDAAPPNATTTDHGSIADTWLHSQQPDTNFSGDHFIIPDGSPVAIALIQFDLSALAGSQVSAAELHIFTDFDPGAQVQAFALTEAWSETQATFNQRANGLAWATPGAAPPSRGTNAIATFTPSPQFTEFVVPMDLATVAGWVANPGSNFGFAITSVNADGPKLVSREGAAGTRPFLRITHTP